MNLLEKALDDARKRVIEEALLLERGNHCATARRLGVHRNTVTRLIRKFGIQLPGNTRKHGRRAA
jgi:DNA-binding PucR family transcriptional regulator